MSRTYPIEIDVEDLVEANMESVLSALRNSIDDLDQYHSFDVDHTEDVDVRELLARHQAIALIWDADMLLHHYPHLTRDQAWQALQRCDREYTAENGLTWDDIAGTVGEMFPEPTEQQRGRDAKAAQIGRIIADYDASGDERENLVDLLTDAMLWCEVFGEPFEEFCGTARIHFAAEANSNGKGA